MTANLIEMFNIFVKIVDKRNSLFAVKAPQPKMKAVPNACQHGERIQINLVLTGARGWCHTAYRC